MNIEPRTDQRRTLVVRADASPQIGTGHLMRCLALAQTWQDAGGNAIFAMAMEAPALEARLQSEGMEVTHLPARPGSTDDAMQTAELARQVNAACVVVDGYHFGSGYQRMIKNSGLGLLFIDDTGHADHYCADIVLNQNLHAHEGLYANREPYTQLLLGTGYVLLRREFLQWWGWQREIPAVAHKVLVTLGGGDPDNVTCKVIQALPQVKIDGLEAVVVVGGSNPHYKKLLSAVRDSRCPIRLESHVTNMADLMAWADLAVSAGGSTCWEIAFMGLPNCIIVLAKNQAEVAEVLQGLGAAIHAGWFASVDQAQWMSTVGALLEDKDRRREMSYQGRQIVDGQGSQRVVVAILDQSREL